MNAPKLEKRGALALIIYFLMITAICAPLAFYAGKAQGKVDTDEPEDLSQIDADLREEYAALYRARRSGAGCGGESDPDTERRAVWEIICHPHYDGDGKRRIANLKDHRKGARRGAKALQRKSAASNRKKRGPLDDIMVAALSADNLDRVGGNLPGAGNGGGAGNPLGLALAPGGNMSARGPGGSVGFGDILFGGPNAPGGLPGNIIPEIQNVVSQPPVDPPTVVTPIPGALPLLLTGLGGLFFTSRRKKSA